MAADQLRQWITQGRANAATRVRAEPGGEWTTLGQLPEFAAALQQPPPLSAASVAPGAPGTPPPTSGLAIASLVLGILGLCIPVVSSLTGLILGIVALRKIDASRGRIGGKGVAIGGMATSAATMLLVIPMMAGMLLPALDRAKEKANRINSVSNLKQIALAARLYANDHGDKFPPAATWCDNLQPLILAPKVFRRPGAPPTDRCGYGYNDRVAGKSVVSPDTILFFELEDSGWNVSGGPSLMRKSDRRGVAVVALADGSVHQVTSAALSQMRWDP